VNNSITAVKEGLWSYMWTVGLLIFLAEKWGQNSPWQSTYSTCLLLFIADSVQRSIYSCRKDPLKFSLSHMQSHTLKSGNFAEIVQDRDIVTTER